MNKTQKINMKKRVFKLKMHAEWMHKWEIMRFPDGNDSLIIGVNTAADGVIYKLLPLKQYKYRVFNATRFYWIKLLVLVGYL